jgi:hypothetical protein
MSSAPFTRAFLLMCSGPIIWAVHFLIIYGFTGLACARRLQHIQWFDIGLLTWVIWSATLIAIAAIILLMRMRPPKNMHQDNSQFVRWLTPALSLLSIVAIIWEAITVFIIPMCK